MKTSISIIGGSGFIGTNLIAKLNSPFVSNIDKSESARFNKITNIADVCDPTLLDNALQQSDWVVLLAAEHRDDVTPVSRYYDVNVQGTQNVLNAMDSKGITKVVFTSSVAVYGLNKDNPSELSEVDPFNHYGKSKYEAEQLLRSWHQKDPENRTLVIIRPTVVFGPNNRGNVYNFLRQIASGMFVMIGDGQNKKSMSFVENITSLIKYIIDEGYAGYHLFNYADKPDMTTSELVRKSRTVLNKKALTLKVPYFVGYAGGVVLDVVAKLLNKKFPISAIRVKKFCASTQFDATKVHSTGYKPTFSLFEGLERTLIHEFIEQQKDEVLFETE